MSREPYSLPRTHSHPNPYASNAYARQQNASGFRVPLILRRLFKFPQMDFEVAIWEMTNLMYAPRKVFRNMYYQKQTKNTYTNSDPAFPYLLSFFLFLTSFAWSLAYAQPSFGNIMRIAFIYVFVHFLLFSIITATIMYFTVGKLFGPGGALVGRLGRRARGLFTGSTSISGDAEQLEWGYCFDVTIRAFLPIFVHLYILQFVLLPVLSSARAVPVILSNLLHLVAYGQSFYITFLGYSSLPFLSSTNLLMAPGVIGLLLWFIIASATGWSASRNLLPILWCFGGLRKPV